MPIYGFEYAFLAVDVSASSDVAVFDFVKTNVAKELFFQLFCRDFEVSVIHRVYIKE